MARIPAITGKVDVATADQHVVDQVLEVFGRVRGPFRILLHSPKLAERLLLRAVQRSIRLTEEVESARQHLG